MSEKLKPDFDHSIYEKIGRAPGTIISQEKIAKKADEFIGGANEKVIYNGKKLTPIEATELGRS